MEADKRIFANTSGGARKGGMDKDTNEHFIPNGFYIDARNVNFMTNGDMFVVKNVKGNTEKTYTLNSGSNICIGAFDDKANETVYAFIWNGDGDHEILKYQYNISVDAVSSVCEGSGINFSFDKLITGITVVNDRFLVWGQEDEEVGCIDLDNPPASTITSANRWEIELAKIEDPEPLECFYISDENRKSNSIDDRSFQFRYRYIYEGGFRSPFSAISKVPVPDNLLLRGNSNYKEYYDNAISVLVPEPNFDKVEKIELFVRYEQDDTTKDSQLWYKFKDVEYDKFNALQPFLDIVFTGTEALTPADPTETLTETSFFPRSVKEVVFLPSNVLSFLNFVDGNDTSAVVPQVRLIPQYKVRPTTKGSATVTASYSPTSTAATVTMYNESYGFEISTIAYEVISIGGTPQVGDTIQLTLDLSYTERSGISNPAGIPATPTVVGKTFEMVYVVKEEDTTTAIIANKLRQVINSTDTRYEGFGGIVALSTGSTVRIYEGDNQSSAPYDVRTIIDAGSTSISVTVDYPTALPNVQFKIRRSKKTLKRNALHPFAIQYKDKKGRRSAAIPIGEVEVLGQDSTSNDDWVELRITIGHTAPSWATHYDILYAKNQTYRDFTQIACNADEIDTNLWRFRVYDNLSAFYSEYADASDTLNSYNYNYAEGDRMRILGVIASNGDVTKFSSQDDFPILRDDVRGVYVKLDSSTYTPSFDNGAVGPIGGSGVDFIAGSNRIVRSTGNWVTDGYTTGQRVKIENASVSSNDLEANIITITTTSSTNDTLVVSATLTADTNDNSATFTRTEKILVECYTPAQESTRLYYEIAAQGTVDSDGYHSGNTQNQTASQAAILDLYNIGDVYQVFIPIVLDSAFLTTNEFIECQHMSPIKTSAVTDIGRGNVENEYSSEIHRSAAITYTQPIIANSPSNGLSLVLSTSLYNEFGSDFGSIQKAFLRQDRQLVMFFEDKVGYMGVFSELRKSANGDVSYATDSLTSQINFYAYDGGIGLNPESFAYYDTTCYFVSPKNNAVCRLAGDGITEISKYGMTSWFNDNLDVKNRFTTDGKFFGVYDERNQNYVLSLLGYAKASFLDGSGQLLGFDLKNAFLGNLADNVTGIILFDGTNYYKEVPILVDPDSADEATVTISGSPQAQDVEEAWLSYREGTLVFNEPANGWVCFMDFNPDFMETCGIDFLSWNDGSTWLHNSNETRGSFYGTTHPAQITVPFNIKPSEVKVFMNIEQETNDPWVSETDGDISTSAGQTSQIFDEWYEQRQPNQFSAWIGKDTSTPTALVPTNKVFEGFDLRDTLLKAKLTQDSTDESELRSVTVISETSNLGY